MSVKLVDVGERLSARKADLRFTSELWWIHRGTTHQFNTVFAHVMLWYPHWYQMWGTLSVLNLFHGCLSQGLLYVACCWRYSRGQFLLLNPCAAPQAVIAHLCLWAPSLLAEHHLDQLLVRMSWEEWGIVFMGGDEPPFSRITRALRNLDFLISVKFDITNTFAPWCALWVLVKEIMHGTQELLCYLHSPCFESFPWTMKHTGAQELHKQVVFI